jgi:PAS domain S-box-containing protein
MRSSLTSSCGDMSQADETILLEGLDDAIANTQADFGNIQLLDTATGDLRIVAQRGFPQWWLDYWDAVAEGQGACGTALERGEPVIVEDVEHSPIFVGTPALEVQLKAGVRAVHSQPLISRAGVRIGILSIHFREPLQPDQHAMRLLKAIARNIADVVALGRSEQLLKNRQQQFRLFMSAASIVTFEWDIQKNRISRPFSSELALPETTQGPGTFEDVVERIHPEDRERFQASIERALATGSYESEHRVVRPDSTTAWLIERGTVEYDAGIPARMLGMALDITRQKVSEQALREQSRITKTVTDNASTALFIMDEHQQCVFMNPAADRMTGYSLEEIRGRSLHDVVHHTRPDGRPYPLSECPIDQAFPRNDREQGEEVFVHRDGHFYPVAFTASPIRDSNGNSIGTVIEVQDISERKRNEDDLKRARNLLEESQQIAQLGSFEYIASNSQTTWSEEEFRIYGLEPNGPSPSYDTMLEQCIHPDDKENLHDTFTKALQNGSVYELEHRIVRPTGEVRWVYDRARPYFDENGKLVRYVGATLDITERKLSEIAIRESEQRLRLALSAGNMAVWDWHIETGKVLWNDEHYTLLGYAPGSVTPSYESWRSRVLPDDLARIEATIQTSLRTGEDYTAVFRVLGKNDVIRWVEALGRVERSPVGKAVRLYGVLLDVTDRLMREQDLHQHIEEIEALYNNAPLGLALMDEDLRYLRINAALARINGAPAAAHVKKTLSDMMPHLAAFLEPRIRSVISSGQIAFGETTTTLSGERVQRVFREIFYPVRGRDGAVSSVGIVVEEITERRRAEEKTATLLKEVNHRAKNLLAVTQAIAQLTAADVEPEQFYDAFSIRLQGLAASHDLLVQAEWQGVWLDRLIKSQLLHLAALLGNRIFLKGPSVTLNPAAVQMIGMVVHELATNAIKYGALSTAEGRVTLCWTVSSDASEAEPRFVMTWTEDGGPPVIAPLRKGFGHAVMVEMPEHLLEARVDLSFPPSGAVWKLTAPLALVGDLPDRGGSHATHTG